MGTLLDQHAYATARESLLAPFDFILRSFLIVKFFFSLSRFVSFPVGLSQRCCSMFFVINFSSLFLYFPHYYGKKNCHQLLLLWFLLKFPFSADHFFFVRFHFSSQVSCDSWIECNIQGVDNFNEDKLTSLSVDIDFVRIHTERVKAHTKKK